jgi:hypothetical protein
MLKKNDITGITFALDGSQLFSPNPRSGVWFCREKILRILAGTARVVVTWFSQYSCLKVQNFAIMGQL